jgi:Flp pilus assembly protein TadG
LKSVPAEQNHRAGRARVSARRLQRRRGSLAIEMALVLLILMLGGWLAVEVIARVQQRQRCAAFTAELRELAQAIQRLPPRTTADATALATALADTKWSKGSALGGRYELISSSGGERVIAVTAFAPDFPLKASRADLLRIDREVDDGDLATGRFRTGFNGWPVYRLEGNR